MLIEATELIMRHNLFKFGDTFWRQIDGTAMGCPPGCSYATLYFAVHEIKLLRIFCNFFRFYRRYIDDGFLIWRKHESPIINQQQWSKFKSTMNRFGKLKWTIEDPSDSVTFLDLTITIKDNRLSMNIHEKENNPYLYLPPSSAHTPGIIKGTIYGMIF